MSSSETDRSESEAIPDGGAASDGEVSPAGSSESGERRSSRARRIDAAIVAMLVLVLAAVGWFFFIRDSGPTGPPAPILETTIEEPISGAVIATDWSSPTAVAVEGDRIHVLDAGNNRILSMDHEGAVDNIICETDDCALLLDAPQDMEVVDGLFYVANTEKGQVDVVTNSGTTVRTYELPSQPGVAPRATGVHVARDGTVYVSDWTSGKVAIFEPDGAFRQYFGEDTVGVFVFTDPTGLTTDDEGNLYVAEFSLGMVRKISPIGRELATYSMMGGVTRATEATDVIISDEGLLYLADNKRSVLHVFSRAANYLGTLGLLDSSRYDSPLALLRPQGIDTVGNKVYIIDAKRGLLIYVVDPAFYLVPRAE